MDERHKSKARNYIALGGKQAEHSLTQKSFFDPPPRVMKIKTKIPKWNLVKLKSFCTAQETVNKMKREPSDQSVIGSTMIVVWKYCKQLYPPPQLDHVEEMNKFL